MWRNHKHVICIEWILQDVEYRQEVVRGVVSPLMCRKTSWEINISGGQFHSLYEHLQIIALASGFNRSTLLREVSQQT